MKKNIVFILLLAGTASFAQNFELGAKAGVNFTNFNGNSNVSSVKANSMVGFHAGGFVSLFLGNNFAIQPEVLFSSQGAKIDNAGTKSNFNLYYITVPVMLKYRFNGGFYIEAGPEAGFKVHESVGGTSEDFAKNVDISVAGGIGYHSSIGLGVGARYVAGLSKVGNLNSSTSPDWKNSLIQVGVFYTLFNNHRK